MTQTATKTNTQQSTWNSVTFTGNLGRDPEMSFTRNGNAVTKFSLAVSQGKDGAGNEKPTMWLFVECWKQLAEDCNQNLTKGARVEVQGRLVQDTWKGEGGEERRAYKVVAQKVRLLKRPSGKSSSFGFVKEEEEGTDDLGDLDDHPF